MARNDEKDEGNADFDHVAKMATRLKLKGRERDRYVHQHMTGLGYKMVPSYVHPDDDDDDDSSGGRFFRRSGRGGRNDDDDSEYPF